RFDNRKSQAGAGDAGTLVGAVKTLEQASLLFDRDAGTVIGDFDVQHRLVDEQVERDLTTGGTVFERVIEIVGDGAAHPTAICLYVGNDGFQINFEVNRLFLHQRADGGADFVDQFAHVDVFKVETVTVLNLFEVEQVVDQVLNAVDAVFGDSDDFVDLWIRRVDTTAQHRKRVQRRA